MFGANMRFFFLTTKKNREYFKNEDVFSPFVVAVLRKNFLFDYLFVK